MNWPLLQNSLLLAGTTTVLAVGFGLVAALWLVTLETRRRNLFLAMAVVALALPPFLVTNCWISLLGDNGVLRAWLPFRIYSLGGTIWILSLMLWPVTLFAVLSAWRRLEAAQFECEPAMSGFALLRWLLLPVARGELALAGVVTFVLALNNFAVPAVLQTKVLPDEMWVRFNTQFDALGALKLSLPLVITPVILLAWASQRGVSWPRIQGEVSAGTVRRQLGSAWRIASGTIGLLLCGLSVGLPLAQIASMKRTWTELPGAVEAGTGAIWNSFWFAALAATVLVFVAQIVNLPYRRLATCLPTASRRYGRLPVCATLAWLPFFIPGVLLGIALIWVFNRPVLAAFYQSAGIVVLAFVIRYFALGWTAVAHALASADSDLTDAAALEGATRWQLFRLAIWPQIAPQMLAVWYVVYLLCLWDVESMILVVPPGGETLALRIFNLLHYGYAAQVNALCVVLLGLAVLPLAFWWIWGTTSNLRHRISNIEGNSKLQAPSSRELSSSKTQILKARTLREVGSFKFLWCLVFGVWCVGTGCSPKSGTHECALHSRLFNRAEVIGTRGVGLGEFNKPRSVAVDRQDNLYAVDMTGRVQKFSPDGRFLLSWQMPQTDLGKPKGMACDRDGNIIVVEPHYSRVNHFTPEGRLVAQWGERGTNAGQFGFPRAVAVNSQGEICVCEYSAMERVQRFAISAAGGAERFGLRQPSAALGSSPTSEKRQRAAAVQDAGAASQTPLLAGAPAAQVSLLGVIGQAGTGPGEFNRPEGLAVDAQDRLYVADSCNHRIQVFSNNGKFLREFGKAGSGLGELSYPYDVAVDARGNVFVCEFGNSRIQVFDTNGQPAEIIGGPGAEPGQFANPWSIALDSHGDLYVADSQNHRVQKLVRRESVVSGQRSVADDHAHAGLRPTMGYSPLTTDY